MKSKRSRVGRDIRPNAGLKASYEKKLVELAEEMHKSVAYWILAAYKRQLPRVDELMARDGVMELAEDASPARDMLAALRCQLGRWKAKYDEKAKTYADWLGRRANATATAGVKASVSEVSGFTVGMSMTRNVNNVIQSVVAENVALIRSIPQKYFLEVEGLVMRSVREGRDIAGLTDDLQKRYGIVRRRALDIARDQTNKATASIARARMQDLGIEKAIWRHSGRSKHPRPSHKAADGKPFDLKEGLMIEGKLTFPGQDINCGCTAAPYFEDLEERRAARGRRGA